MALTPDGEGCGIESHEVRFTQGYVLGPIRFLMFINDIDNTICSNILKFADDTKVCGVVDNQLDGQQLQSDLESGCSRW